MLMAHCLDLDDEDEEEDEEDAEANEADTLNAKPFEQEIAEDRTTPRQLAFD